LVVNKVDLAPHVGADLAAMKRDAGKVRPGKPVEFVNCKTGTGVESVARHIIDGLLFDRKRVPSHKRRKRN
jgi:urease accessory protein